MASITSANAVFLLSINGLYSTPQQLQGFGTDDMFTTEAIETKETMMGVDGVLSAGLIPAIVPQTVTLQADSDSNDLFDAWNAAEKAGGDVMFATGSITLTSTGRTYALIQGVLKRYKPIPDAAKTLRPRQYGLEWQASLVAPI